MNKLCLLAFALRRIGSGSEKSGYGSKDPDPYKDLTDLEQCVYKGSKASLYKFTANSGNNNFQS
jgi:hypothetical protein